MTKPSLLPPCPLQILADMCKDGQLMVDLFVNYDCDLESSNLYERMVNGLVKVAQHPVRGGRMRGGAERGACILLMCTVCPACVLHTPYSAGGPAYPACVLHTPYSAGGPAYPACVLHTPYSAGGQELGEAPPLSLCCAVLRALATLPALSCPTPLPAPPCWAPIPIPSLLSPLVHPPPPPRPARPLPPMR